MAEPLDLYPFQERVFNLLSQGHNVILQAPTGSGKTRAALYPFLYNLAEERPALSRKCIYAVPMRALANQFVDKYRPSVESYDRRFRLRLSRPDYPGASCVEILTGEQERDRKLEATLTFATIDQVLSSYLLAPYALPRRLANFNAGAMVASYLVFDEFHLFDPISTLPTTLEMLRQLNGVSPFLLMTATFSANMLDGLAERLSAQVVPGTLQEREALERLPSQQKTRRYHAVDESLSAEAVLHRHTGGRTLVVCNTVARAQALYERVKARHENTLLLHSRFLAEDRRQCEETIRKVLGREGDKDADLILIATQVVEVGLDITCRTLLTELAPANAVVQRAGRCARYPGEEGDVFVYGWAADPHTGEEIDLRERVNPYRGLEQEFSTTWEFLQARSKSAFDFATEQEWISSVHGPRDGQIVEGLKATSGEHRRAMYAVMRGESARVSHLIRNIRSFRITIHPDWQAVRNAGPLRIEQVFSLPDVVMYGALPGLVERANAFDGEGEPLVALYEVPDRQADEENRAAYERRLVNSAADVAGAALIVIHPDLATYDKDLGLLLDRGGEWACHIPDREASTRASDERFSYRLESYQEHIRQVWEAFEQVAWPEIADVAERLERAFGWAEGSLHRAAELAVLLHDVGKLSVGWQRYAHEWQRRAGNPQPDDFLIAHTDNYLPEHREIRSRMRSPKANHAGEGAYACIPLVDSLLGDTRDLVWAVCAAILRHHTPFAEDHRDYKLVREAPGVIKSTLADLGRMETQPAVLLMEPRPGISLGQFVGEPEHEGFFLAYVLLARALRRADQLGTAQGMAQ